MSTAAAEPSDAELLLRVRGGEPEAFADLYQRHRGMALQVAARNSRNWADAEDVTAEAFAQIYRAIVNGAGQPTPSSPTCSPPSVTPPRVLPPARTPCWPPNARKTWSWRPPRGLTSKYWPMPRVAN